MNLKRINLSKAQENTRLNEMARIISYSKTDSNKELNFEKAEA